MTKASKTQPRAGLNKKRGDQLFSLILMRMSGGIFLNPFLRRSEVPSTVKTGMAFLLTLILFPLSQAPEIRMENSLVFAAALLQEFAVGAVMGFVLELFAVIATMAGAVIDFQMGFSIPPQAVFSNGHIQFQGDKEK